MTTDVLLILFLLFTKHFIIDFPFQIPYHYKNKGTYGHLGGIQHSLLHGAGTFFCIFWFDFEVAIYLSIFDFLLHYHIDWAKMNLNSKLGLGPTTSEKFWWLLGLDQYLHALTYLMFIWIIVGL